jgi:hypothetical protein
MGEWEMGVFPELVEGRSRNLARRVVLPEALEGRVGDGWTHQKKIKSKL